jgi:hypothetical protein
MIENIIHDLRDLLTGMEYGEVVLTLKVQDSRVVFIERARVDREKPDNPQLVWEV